MLPCGRRTSSHDWAAFRCDLLSVTSSASAIGQERGGRPPDNRKPPFFLSVRMAILLYLLRG